MNGQAITALTLTALWLGTLTLVALLTIRQVGLIMVRLEHLRFDPAADGLAIGTTLPPEVAMALPEQQGLLHVLLLSSSCTPCRQLIADLQELGFHPAAPVVALITGRNDPGGELSARLPPGIRTVQDPSATELAHHLRLQSAPFILSIQHGRVIAKANLITANEFVQFTRKVHVPAVTVAS